MKRLLKRLLDFVRWELTADERLAEARKQDEWRIMQEDLTRMKRRVDGS